MPSYMYAARDSAGKMQQGREDAATEIDLIKALHTRGLTITRLTLVSAYQTAVRPKAKIKRHLRIKAEDMLFFISQSAVLLEAGVPLIRAFKVIDDQTESMKLHRTLGQVIENIQAGATLHGAIAKHPKLFPDFWVHVIEAGEASGNLPFVLNQLAVNYAASLELKKKLISALVYPAILITGSIVAILIFMLKIIPVFKKLFDQFNAKLPALTQSIIYISDFIKINIIFIVLGSAFLVYFFRLYFSTPTGKRFKDGVFINLPIFGGPIRDVIHARMNIILSTLIKSGINIVRAIEITARVAGNVIFEKALRDVALDIQQGKTLSHCLSQNPLFSTMMVNLIMIGEEGGKIAEMIDRSSRYFQDKVDVFMARLSVMIEPLILIFVGIIVGVIVIAMFLPILSLSSAIK